MKRLISLFLIVPVLMLTGCGQKPFDEGRDYVGVCVDPQTNQRVDDSRCGANHSSGMSNFFWGYLLANALMPRVGYPIGSYQRNVPAGHNWYRGGVPAGGGRVNYSTYRPSSSNVKGATGGGFKKSYQKFTQKMNDRRQANIDKQRQKQQNKITRQNGRSGIGGGGSVSRPRSGGGFGGGGGRRR